MRTGYCAKAVAILAGWLTVLPALAAESLTGVSYRGWIQSEGGALAVLSGDGHERVLGVGDTLAGDWKVTAIDAQSVGLQHRSSADRYVLWFGGGGSGTLPKSLPSASPASSRLQWDAPSAVQSGSEFSVVLSLPGLSVQDGYVTLDYDPAALVFIDTGGEREDHAGRVRLPVADGGEFLAEFTFRVIAQVTSVTRLRMQSLELIDDAGDPISVPAADELRIEIAGAAVAPKTPTTETRRAPVNAAKLPLAKPSAQSPRNARQ